MADHQARFSELCCIPYKDQAIFFMNGFWGDACTAENAEHFWNMVQKFVELDKGNRDGFELDQFWSAKFLEDFDDALSALARKSALRTIDINNNGKMSLIEYTAWKYNKSVEETVNSPQGGGTPEDAKQLAEAQKSLAQLAQLLTELQAAQAAQKAEEDALAKKKKALQDLIDNGSGVKKAKASNELAQLNAEDPLPLRKAKLTTDAAVRKVLRQMTATQKIIEELKKRGGVAAGVLWYMEREIFEADSRLPSAKMKYDHKKPFFYDPLA
mmetsp:Transcript_30385/g.47168  ORF Transcript_30385/g.47168 Transcript_30385/m.47168 type:complete len:270 (-) Transcript_30385:53-862(-)|eukprot:CAMPEP_0201521068 /NCGR_PEP_ID=MMETSP0161_2-20130828/13996_1 /ASSEMBLY_ACC=CAM_ASM_000251 /TAXON_ID=180227 /ORGANISM="Neoparamoeba aestuarina, Strain SoJaBio B1-5/56/2" /LENGTH=269 /DNA_ID=CAMNT_0047919631 /DNA_START=81 /DNA_END=890 /DNA_ORIENTATION=+